MGRTMALLLLAALLGCNGHSPTEPRAITVAAGRWTGGGACLIVAGDNYAPQMCRLSAGCGQGQFVRPLMVRSDGSFDVEGTWGIVAGPTRQDPLPPAHYSGILSNTTLTLTVTPANAAPMTYTMRMDPGESCPVPCV